MSIKTLAAAGILVAGVMCAGVAQAGSFQVKFDGRAKWASAKFEPVGNGQVVGHHRAIIRLHTYEVNNDGCPSMTLQDQESGTASVSDQGPAKHSGYVCKYKVTLYKDSNDTTGKLGGEIWFGYNATTNTWERAGTWWSLSVHWDSASQTFRVVG